MTGKRRALEANLAAAQTEIANLKWRLEEAIGSPADRFHWRDIDEVSAHSAHPGVTGGHELSGGSPEYERVRMPDYAKQVFRADLEFDVPPGFAVAYLGYWNRKGEYLGCAAADGAVQRQQSRYSAVIRVDVGMCSA